MLRRLGAILLIVMVLSSFLLSGCERRGIGKGHEFPKPPQEVLEMFDPSLIEGSNDLGVNIFSRLAAEDENVFISPVSIATALAMTYNGARHGTKDAMADVLGIEGVNLKQFNENNQALLYLLQEADPSIDLHIANSLWMREGVEFDEDFLQRNEEHYNAAMRELNFHDDEAAEIINQWVKERTGGHIEDIVEPPIDPLTILFLINAVYFQGDWSTPFPEENTADDTFYLPGGAEITVPFMHRSGEADYYEEDNLQAVRLPYGEEERLAMYVLLPGEELGFNGLVDIFNTAWWNERKNQFRKAEGDLYLPSFNIEYEKTLNDVLQELGMGIAFDSEQADLFDMVPREEPPRLYISEVKHKSFIDVSEKGTEAAAATSVEIELESAPPFFFDMKVDRPFLYLIQDDETGALLFMGSVTDPS